MCTGMQFAHIFPIMVTGTGCTAVLLQWLDTLRAARALSTHTHNTAISLLALLLARAREGGTALLHFCRTASNAKLSFFIVSRTDCCLIPFPCSYYLSLSLFPSLSLSLFLSLSLNLFFYLALANLLHCSGPLQLGALQQR